MNAVFDKHLVSIVVCTAGRPVKLQALLNSFATLLIPPAFTVELVVVNNQPDSDIRSMVSKMTSSLPLSVKQVIEAKPGLGGARNTGVAHSRGDIIAFTDDDCLVDRDWLTRIWTCFADDSELMGLGGRVELYNPADNPITTLQRTSANLLSSPEQVFGFLHGCNMAFRRTVLERLNCFDPRFGVGSPINSGDDAEFLYRAHRAGCRIRYEPQMLVYHDHGRRSWAQVRRAMTRYHLANGAILAKHAQAGDISAKALLKKIATRPVTSLRNKPYSIRESLRACYHFGSYGLGAMRYWLFASRRIKR